MAKKKKKSHGDGGPVSSPPPKVPTQDERLVDCTVLEIIPSSTPPTKSLQYNPSILLTSDDADELGVVTGDYVLLLSKKEWIESTAMARVYVASSSPPKSPSGRLKTQRSKLSPGCCHVFPVSLAHRLEGHNIVEQAQEAPSTPSPVISTPSPSKSKFSFARGGGGDLLISSPTTPKAQQRKSRKSNELWVVPVESTLGDQLTQLICSTASHIAISTEEQTSILQGSFGTTLMRAHLLLSYVSKGTDVAISVQGLSIPCQITDIRPTTKEVELQLSNLSLEESKLDAESQNLLQTVHKSLLSYRANQSADKIQLFQITRDTALVFGNSSATDSVTNSTSSQPSSLLAGLDETIEKVQSLLMTPLLHPELFQSDNSLRPPKGVLLYGSSGSGKSTLATQVAQTLRIRHKVHVQEISCSKLQSQTSLVGQAERELVRHFEIATNYSSVAASLIVLDDVHLICPRRQGMNVGADRLASTLLALLDGVDHSKEKKTLVMVLAVTNNPSLLDPALRRPGRLDAEVEIPLPDEPATRSKILQFQLKSFGVSATIDDESDEWIGLARLAKGFTGADIQLAAKEAIRMSILRDSRGRNADLVIEVTKQDIETAIRSIKPSAIKAVSVEIPQVHWSSIGGMDEVKRQLREAIELPLTHEAMFQRLGIRPPRGVLLYGPPGCSKTLMARALATEGHMNFLAVKGPELLSKWLGESERALASLFRRARLASPSIIFFDEVDAIATKRGGGSSGGGERLLSQLLTELDGIQSGGDQKKHRVVVICATNRPDLLDGALMRPGRIDRMIYVGVPDMPSRLRILEIGLQGKSCEVDLDVSTNLAVPFSLSISLTK